jgi:transposase-like protein
VQQHTDEDKATALAALDANDGNVAKTARQVGIARQTLGEWAHNRKINRAVPELRHLKKRSLSAVNKVAEEEIIKGGVSATVAKTSPKGGSFDCFDRRYKKGGNRSYVPVIELRLRFRNDSFGCFG